MVQLPPQSHRFDPAVGYKTLQPTGILLPFRTDPEQLEIRGNTATFPLGGTVTKDNAV